MLKQFGNLQFNRQEMKKRLPSPIYKKWKTALYRETVMDRETADAMAHAMKEWALEKDATHYTHWFIPLTGLSAEKHNTFITKEEELPLLHFSGSSLIKGETDGSSFPTGGLRATFEARGFTYWDISSFAFVRGHVLYIPSIFVSYRGDQLDLKSPLLRAVDTFNQRATELLHLLGGKEIKGVKPMIGLEQEYFLVRKEHYLQRPDLFYTGRTLIGAPPPKGQEFEDHYLGSIPTKVSEFMQDVNLDLWRLGIFAQCEHNESAPAQFEIVSHQEIASLSIDQNMILMDVLKQKAAEHG
ncbi:MAG TPA: glutamine synthetase III, partial [Clostridia bacterium]|nr:glutamine synthetase III [Clostridia bacterium]